MTTTNDKLIALAATVWDEAKNIEASLPYQHDEAKTHVQRCEALYLAVCARAGVSPEDAPKGDPIFVVFRDGRPVGCATTEEGRDQIIRVLDVVPKSGQVTWVRGRLESPLTVPSAGPPSWLSDFSKKADALRKEISEKYKGPPPASAVFGTQPFVKDLHPDDIDAKVYPVREREDAIRDAALKVVEAMDVDAREIKVPGVLALALLNLRNAVKRGQGTFEERVADVLARKCDELQAENEELRRKAGA